MLVARQLYYSMCEVLNRGGIFLVFISSQHSLVASQLVSTFLYFHGTGHPVKLHQLIMHAQKENAMQLTLPSKLSKMDYLLRLKLLHIDSSCLHRFQRAAVLCAVATADRAKGFHPTFKAPMEEWIG